MKLSASDSTVRIDSIQHRFDGCLGRTTGKIDSNLRLEVDFGDGDKDFFAFSELSTPERTVRKKVWLVIRTHAGEWTTGGTPADYKDYVDHEVYAVIASDCVTAKAKAQSLRRRTRK